MTGLSTTISNIDAFNSYVSFETNTLLRQNISEVTFANHTSICKPENDTSLTLPSRRQISPWAINPSSALPDSLRNNWNSLASCTLTPKTFQKLQSIASKPDSWRGSGSKKLKSLSLRSFLKLWKEIDQEAEEPFVTLAPNGHLYAEWHASWRRHLDVEFAADGSVFFGLFHNRDAIEGKTSLEHLIATMRGRRQNPFQWKYVAQ